MSLMDKIEEIRKKPEHIRMRYVWGSLAVSMIFIIIIWIFSMVVLFRNNETQGPDISPFKKQLQNAPSLKEISGKAFESANSPVVPDANIIDNQPSNLNQ